MKDNCVVCKSESIYDRNENILFRIGYISGVGQLCLDCYNVIYIKPMKDLKHKGVTTNG